MTNKQKAAVVPRTCIVCGSSFEIRQHVLSSRERRGGRAGIFCSIACRGVYQTAKSESVSIRERIERYIEREGHGGCWRWTASLNDHGYGQLRIRSEIFRAHRLSYEEFVGPIPDGLHIDHLCENRWCVNPEHLEPVTHAENLRRFAERRTHCFHGHAVTEENTYVRPDGSRECRVCIRARVSGKGIAA